LLKIPRLGVLNAHLALLPEIRGMNSPEWSLLYEVPLGVTIHFMDTGIDTGPILLRREFTFPCESLTDLRNRMIAFGMDLLLEAVAGLEKGTLSAVPQSDRDKDHQFFVMHDRLKVEATRRLQRLQSKLVADRVHG
jgi:methionyl-tRNA formyltransferase